MVPNKVGLIATEATENNYRRVHKGSDDFTYALVLTSSRARLRRDSHVLESP